MASFSLLGTVLPGAPFWGSSNGVEEDLADVDASARQPWDTVYLAGLMLPGICEIKPTGVAGIEIDKKKPKGSHGARLTFLGYDPRTFDIPCTIWTESHWNDVQKIISRLWRGPKATKDDENAISVQHPALQAMKIFSAVISGISPPVKGPVEGLKIITFHMHERGALKKAVVKSAEFGGIVHADVRAPVETKNSEQISPGEDSNYTAPFPKAPPASGAF